MKFCYVCERTYSRSGFSNTQYRKPDGMGRCLTCVSENSQSFAEAHSVSRYNESTEMRVTQSQPYARGQFKVVYLGEYTTGKRAQGFRRPCVKKVFQAQFQGLADSYFKHDLEVVAAAEQIVKAFNDAGIIDKIVRINRPEIWTDCLVEPFISDFKKFNSNSGWSATSSSWDRAMQGLSHFSYHYSNGQTLLCDVQGGLNGHGALLTDPVINSRSRKFGPSDLGPRGISTWFSQHRCGEYCRRAWLVPRDQQQYLPATKGSSMEHVPTQPHRRTYIQVQRTPLLMIYREKNDWLF